ncbi:MAG: Gfo/Idh/MocA family oxidoreductase [Bacteroidetes bacterium]|nr:Gfo/Idh/MocA family oxidoreductase [Bacteroidota bacterium]MBT4400973.1 Gfo/Idh/MocA family oxidoreductase [Bacteroidota bacterium]MBT4410135.1 Gfo/Idh/MocA family oxidoreductase [Bacteroidota bacterium]MBT5424785.1 Gfo/Idh/MocA family oxidoreductase [Bacteroidota bacterium]MBT7093688.1 Gfo/Idh/MocA family oxidoreductase [Bacteroidota bacterium]
MKEKILVGLCSYGMSGRVFHAPLLTSHYGFELYSVLERSKNICQNNYPAIKRVKQFDELIKDPLVEIIIINIPDHLHAEFTEAALLAGKHVVVEKPFTLDVASAIRLNKIASERNLHIFVFQNRRWDSDFLTIRSLIESGRLGRIVEFEAHFDRFRPEPTPNTWKEDEKLGTGILYNLGAHLIDQALVLFGLPDAVYADLDIIRSNSKLTDYFTLILYYKRKRAVLRSSYVVKEHPAKYLIHGDLGSFIKSGQDPQEERLNNGWNGDIELIGKEPEKNWGRLYIESNLSGHPEVIKSVPGRYMSFYDEVYKTMRSDFTGAVMAEDGIRVIQIIEAAIQSNKSGTRINISQL